MKFDIDNTCQSTTNAPHDLQRKQMIKTAFDMMEDIPSEDEDPLIICRMEDVGIEFNLLRNIN